MLNRVRRLLRYLADASVVRQPRYRAWERRHVRAAARAGAAVVVVVFLIGAALLSSVAPAVMLLNPPMALVATFIYLALRWRSGPRRNPSGGALVLAILALTNSLLPLGFASEAGGVLLAHVAMVIVASALFIAAFMRVMDKYSWLKTLLISVAVSVTLYWMFEIQFMVPLPKGPLEALIGY